MPVSFFFEGLEGNPRPLEVHGVAVDMLSEKETLQLLGNYYMLPEEQRRQLSGLIKILAKSD